MSPRPWASAWLSPFALSNTAIGWATIIGAFSSLVLVPGPQGMARISWEWALVVLASQATFAGILVLVRRAVPLPGPAAVFAALALGGALRGVVLALGAGSVWAVGVSVTDLAARAVNSTVVSVIGVALIGATLRWRSEFRDQYRLLRERAILLGTAAQEGDEVEPSVLEAWTSMKKDLDVTLKEASRRLEAGASPQDLEAAAALLVEAIDVNLRPSARAMWQETVPEENPIRLVPLLVDTIAQWRLPLRTILAFFLVVVGLGSVIRSGIVNGGEYTVRYLVITGLILWASTSLARLMPRRAPLIALLTLVLLPPLILLGDNWIGSRLLGLPVDPAGQIVVALQTPVTTVFIAMAIEAVRARDEVLSALQARINAEVALLLQQKGRSRRDAQRLSLFVHHSVQSELSAIAMRASEAALGHDVATMDTFSHEARERIGYLESLDAHSAPWMQPARGRERIDVVVQAWTGLLRIDLALPEESACSADQWELAARVVEEALANAARHSGATHLVITGDRQASTLLLEVTDNGRREADSSVPGLGTWWLDRIAPGEWSLEHEDQGSTLTVRIR